MENKEIIVKIYFIKTSRIPLIIIILRCKTEKKKAIMKFRKKQDLNQTRIRLLDLKRRCTNDLDCLSIVCCKN